MNAECPDQSDDIKLIEAYMKTVRVYDTHLQ